MLITMDQDDFHYAVASVVCVVFLFVFFITTKRLDPALKKPWLALILAVVVGVVVDQSNVIPMVVIGVLCFGLLVGIVRNLIPDRDAMQKKRTPFQPEVQQPDADSARTATDATEVSATPLNTNTEWINSLMPILSLMAMLTFFGLMYLMLNKNQFMVWVGLIHSTPSSLSSVQWPPSIGVNTALADTATITEDVQRETAFRAYQQAKIDHETSAHSVDEAWVDLLSRAVKRDRQIWLSRQQAWINSKSLVCGSIDALHIADADTAPALDLKIKTLRCHTDANRNRASYIRSSVESLIQGHQPTDEIGDLIQNLNNR